MDNLEIDNWTCMDLRKDTTMEYWNLNINILEEMGSRIWLLIRIIFESNKEKKWDWDDIINTRLRRHQHINRLVEINIIKFAKSNTKCSNTKLYDNEYDY